MPALQQGDYERNVFKWTIYLQIESSTAILIEYVRLKFLNKKLTEQYGPFTLSHFSLYGAGNWRTGKK